jgi:hypothetical protein
MLSLAFRSEYRISNIEYRISNIEQGSSNDEVLHFGLRHSLFDIRYSCRQALRTRVSASDAVKTSSAEPTSAEPDGWLAERLL